MLAQGVDSEGELAELRELADTALVEPIVNACDREALDTEKGADQLFFSSFGLSSTRISIAVRNALARSSSRSELSKPGY